MFLDGAIARYSHHYKSQTCCQLDSNWDKNASMSYLFEEVNQKVDLFLNLLFPIDQTLYPYHRHISFKQYHPYIPAKNGLLCWSLSNTTVPYTYRSLPYGEISRHGKNLPYWNWSVIKISYESCLSVQQNSRIQHSSGSIFYVNTFGWMKHKK